MAKRITLIRHAKSSWKDASLADRDRPLNARGKQDAPMMGQRLVKRGARPSLILTSPAKRARATVRLIARAMGYPIEFLQSEEALYLADPDRLLDVVAKQDSSFNEIIVCAHNPGITELSNRLTGKNIDNVPTCGTVVIEADIVDWNELRGADCTLSYFDYPKRESD